MSDHDNNNNETPSLLKRLLLLISFIKFSTYGVILLLHDLDILNQLKKCIFSSSSTNNNNNNNNNQKIRKTMLDKSDKSLELILNETIQDFQNRSRRNSNSPQTNNDKNENGENSDDDDDDGYYAIVTGANSGIGYETVKVLALNGINVIMACRSLERANQARERLEGEMRSKCLTSPLLWNSSGDGGENRGDGNGEKNCGGENREKKGDEKNEKNLSVGKLLVLQCDLGDLQSVKSFAQEVIQARYRVNLLINNAGVMLPPLELTKQGFETQFGSNFLAHFLLTHLMLDTLNRNGPSRIINVSSAAHWNGVIDWSNISPRSVHDYDPCFGYMQSKVCQIMSTYKLHRHLEERSMSRNVTVNVLHPGIISSNISTNLPAWATFLQNLLVKRHSLNTFQGAIATLYLALSPEVSEVSGQYFARCMPVRSNAVSYDVAQQDRLWKISMEMIKDFL